MPTLLVKRYAILISAGYIIAVLFATMTVVLLQFGPTILPDNGKFGSFYRQLNTFFPMLVIGSGYTAMFAWPGFILSIYLAHKNNLHSSRFYMIAGIATAALAHILFALVDTLFVETEGMIITYSLIGGAAGGFAYFLWRNKMLSVWQR